MMNTKTLLPELRALVGELAEDLLARSTSDATIDAGLKEAFHQIEKGGRTAQAFEVWRDDYLDQVAVAWVLACVFVRFMEDNGLIDACWLAGEGERRRLAEDTHELFFRKHPLDTDREYFQHVFREVGQIPAARDLFAEGKTPLWAVAPSGDAAMMLLKFWREIDAESGQLKRAFQVESGDTRFLGDLYQELSEKAKKKYALLQTPVFVEEFILDRTLTPALSEFGLEKVRMIDPTCGSGHFLLGGFARLFDLWSQRESNEIKAAQKALDGVWGVDINPFAVAIARFRLIVAAVQACGIKRLKHAPGWNIHLASGDSLLFGSKPTSLGNRIDMMHQLEAYDVNPIYAVEDRPGLRAILDQGYHVVVGNPPYITVKDKAQNDRYRAIYKEVCHRQYSLGVPFTQRFWELALQAREAEGRCGYVGMITANSFMKREFGKKLIEEFFRNIDLTHVIDTSGAYIPGHGTPTVILFARARKPVGETVRAVLGIKGEPTTPENAAQGLVWQSIVSHIDTADAQDEFTSTADVPRVTFAKHPWTIGGGGTGDLKELICEADTTLGSFVESIGRTTVVGEDDCWIMDGDVPRRHRFSEACLSFGVGDRLRDWQAIDLPSVIYPYRTLGGDAFSPLPTPLNYWLWPFRSLLAERSVFGKSMADNGKHWYEHLEHYVSKLRTPLSIAFAFVATHNHFVLDRGGKVFKQSAPIIKLPADATEDDHLALLGLLNSSTACFWMKQVMTGKHKGDGGEAHADPAYQRFEFAGTQLEKFPVPELKPLSLSRRLDEIARQLGELAAERILKRWARGEDLKLLLAEAEAKCVRLRGQMIALQEELDWECYRHYALLADDLCYPGDYLPELRLGERAFEIVMARQMKAGALQTAWFERHGSTPITEIPTHWPAAYRTLVERRIKLIETHKEIGLIERPEYKRRWNTEPWAEQQERALKHWLLDRLEDRRYWPGVELQSTARLADRASGDAEFMEVAALYRDRAGFDVAGLVAELVEGESVPFLPGLRYKPTGLRKREVWERTWDLQRREDAGEQVGAIPVPPKYTSADFQKTDFWRLRGKLDVPKERWISYPHCSSDSDPTLLVGWAGWNHLQQAEALVGYYDARKREGWDARRLTPLLAGLDQLLPWIHQWHPEIDPEFGETAGQSYQTLLEQDAHELGLTLEDIRTWTPAKKEPRNTRNTRKKEGGPR
ncbi:MAG: BREX-2 system adenine-specific DNA-methyltransferase PglX [Gemmataceae bacterium]